VARFDYREVQAFAQQLLRAVSLPADDAELTARLLVKADLHGYPPHGVAILPTYLERLEAGLLQIAERPKIVREAPASALIDGNFCFGQVVAHQAMTLAIQKAQEHGVAVVCAFRSGHMGRLSDYVELAAERGMIGIAAVSVGTPSIPPYGGMSGVAGTNPMAFGIPGTEGQHMILDFATAAMARREVDRRGSRGEPLPEGVLLDASGRPTTDYQVFLGPPQGALMPFGGHKGSGVNLVTEVLAGILAGNGLGRDWRDKGGPAINGGYFQAVRVDQFLPLEAFLGQIDDFKGFVKSSTPRPGFDEILIPGERSRRAAEKHRQEGIEIEDREWDQLARWATRLGVSPLPEPFGG
jgi:uncharacterized oxidoreductase